MVGDTKLGAKGITLRAPFDCVQGHKLQCQIIPGEAGDDQLCSVWAGSARRLPQQGICRACTQKQTKTTSIGKAAAEGTHIRGLIRAKPDQGTLSSTMRRHEFRPDLRRLAPRRIRNALWQASVGGPAALRGIPLRASKTHGMRDKSGGFPAARRWVLDADRARRLRLMVVNKPPARIV